MTNSLLQLPSPGPEQQITVSYRNKTYIVPDTIPSIEQSLRRIFIAETYFKKFRDIAEDNPEWDTIMYLLGKWRIYSGIINDPDVEEYAIIHEFVRLQFGELNIFDLNECIMLVTANKLEVKRTDDSFGTFSCAFVGRNLSAYISYKKTAIFDVKAAINKIEAEKVIPVGDDEKLLSFREALLFAKKTQEAGQIYRDLGHPIYTYILIQTSFEISAELTDKAIEYGKNIATSDYSEKTSIKNLLRYHKFVNEDFIMTTRINAAHFIVNEWLKTIPDMSNYITNITIEDVTKVEKAGKER